MSAPGYSYDPQNYTLQCFIILRGKQEGNWGGGGYFRFSHSPTDPSTQEKKRRPSSPKIRSWHKITPSTALSDWGENNGYFYSTPCDPLCFCFLLFPLTIFALRLSLRPSSNSDPGSHSRRSSPLPTTVRALFFYRDKNSALSSLVDSRRIVPTHATLSAVDSFLFVQRNNFQSHHGDN